MDGTPTKTQEVVLPIFSTNQRQLAEAIDALQSCSEKAPSRIDIYLALGWCYKRTGRLDLAIQSLERAVEIDPTQAILHYNLACYWSLARNRRRALQHLANALDIDGNFRSLVIGEQDFDPLRNDPLFQSLTAVIG